MTKNLWSTSSMPINAKGQPCGNGHKATYTIIEVFQKIADGEDIKTIARESNNSYRGLRTRLVRYFPNIGADNLQHAIAILFRQKLIK